MSKFLHLSGGDTSVADFVSRLLTYDPNTRMTMEEALDHPFLRFDPGGSARKKLKYDEKIIATHIGSMARYSRVG